MDLTTRFGETPRFALTPEVELKNKIGWEPGIALASRFGLKPERFATIGCPFISGVADIMVFRLPALHLRKKSAFQKKIDGARLTIIGLHDGCISSYKASIRILPMPSDHLNFFPRFPATSRFRICLAFVIKEGMNYGGPIDVRYPHASPYEVQRRMDLHPPPQG